MMAFDKELAAEMAVAVQAAAIVPDKAGSVAHVSQVCRIFCSFYTGRPAGVSTDSIWSAGAWLMALLVVALLKPLLETQPLPA